MKTLETERLILRKFKEDDFTAVHSYVSCAENLIYVVWGPNNEQQARDYVSLAIREAAENPIKNYHYAVIHKETDMLIGGCGFEITFSDSKASLGWLLHRDYWKQGYGTEIAKSLFNINIAN